MKLPFINAIVVGIVVLVFSCVDARAQETRENVFIAPGGVSAPGGTTRSYQIGGGIERLLERGFGASGDIAAVLPGQGSISNTSGLAAIDLNYHFKGVRTEPFVVAGYSLLFRDFTANMFNFGGGINYWFAQDYGLRLEFRDSVGSLQNGPRAHYWAFRIGFNFR